MTAPDAPNLPTWAEQLRLLEPVVDNLLALWRPDGATPAEVASSPRAETGSADWPGLLGPVCSRRALRALAFWRLRAIGAYLVSLWGVWVPHQRQYFFISTRSGLFRFDLFVW